jgi:hypothetical protein
MMVLLARPACAPATDRRVGSISQGHRQARNATGARNQDYDGELAATDYENGIKYGSPAGLMEIQR